MMLWIVITVVVLGVINATLMSVFERTKEIGIMLALGTAPGQVVRIVVAEVAWLSAAGILAGLGVGTLLVFYVALPLGEMEFAGVVFTEMRGKLNLLGHVVDPVLIFVGSLVSALYPARKAAKLNPVRALREI